MSDQHTLLVSYKTERGEPRGPHKKGQPWDGRGDCIDCNACVAVCPTGIDIRDGSQLECIQCALCADACNGIMDRVGRPRGLIGYDTIARRDAKAQGLQHEAIQVIRPRTILYAAVFALVGLIMLVAYSRRTTVEVNVLPDRNPPYVRLSAGGVRNGYVVKILNKLHEPHEFDISLSDLPGAEMSIASEQATGAHRITVPTDELKEIRIFVTVPQAELSKLKGTIVPFSFVVRDVAAGTTAARTTRFQSGNER